MGFNIVKPLPCTTLIPYGLRDKNKQTTFLIDRDMCESNGFAFKILWYSQGDNHQ